MLSLSEMELEAKHAETRLREAVEHYKRTQVALGRQATRWRGERGLTHRHITKHMGIAVGQLNSLERGESHWHKYIDAWIRAMS